MEEIALKNTASVTVDNNTSKLQAERNLLHRQTRINSGKYTIKDQLKSCSPISMSRDKAQKSMKNSTENGYTG